MERPAATSPSSTNSSAFVRWEEVFVSSDRGRREVHYYLKRKDGSSDLAVIGKEKSLRHMSYHYAIRNRSLISIAPSSSLVKLRSRREVIDWLNSLVQGVCTVLLEEILLLKFCSLNFFFFLKKKILTRRGIFVICSTKFWDCILRKAFL